MNRTINIDNEYIICSAIWFDDGTEYEHQPKNIKTGFVICGRRHHNCYITMKILLKDNIDMYEKVQGFLTSHNEFIDRKKAGKLAYKNGQTTEFRDILFSEDLY